MAYILERLARIKTKCLVRLFDRIKDTPNVGYVVHSLTAKVISGNMLRQNPYNLNAMSHDCAMDLVRTALENKVNVKEVYVDTVGDPDSYQRKLTSIFSREYPSAGIKFTVTKKADSLFKTVSAASIAAKVTRDHIVSTWQWEEKGDYFDRLSLNIGSGYPADPKTSEWMEKNIDPCFGYPSFIRFSWSTVKDLLGKRAIDIEFYEPGEDSGAGMGNIANLMKPKNKRRRGSYERKGLELVSGKDF